MAKELAKITPEKGKEIVVQFNPAEYSISQNAKYSEKSAFGTDGPIVQYISGSSQELKLELFFNTYKNDNEECEDVSIKTEEIRGLMEINSDLHRPPICTFTWSSLEFTGVITDVSHQFTMFLDNGTPVRAKLDVTFKSVLNQETAKRITPFHSPDRTKYRTITQDTTLWQLAYEEYGDTEKWREIAEANDIMNPLEIENGTIVSLPAL